MITGATVVTPFAAIMKLSGQNLTFPEEDTFPIPLKDIERDEANADEH